MVTLLLATAGLCAQSASSQVTKSSTHSTQAAPKTTSPKVQATASKAVSKSDGDLEAVLDQLDRASANFRNTQADFVWNQYQKVVDETDVQKGLIYFVREKAVTEMAADITVPDKKYVLFVDGKLKLYQPRIEQLTVYDTGKNRADLESFLVLGFGGRGHDLPKAFDVKFEGYENLEGTKVAKLSMAPKSPRVRGIFEKVTLWIDTDRGVSLKQQFFEPSGDYRVALYSNFKLNGKIPSDAFKLKTTSKTKTITPGQ
jgi:outer membrane lipoprotein-sorting protein